MRKYFVVVSCDFAGRLSQRYVSAMRLVTVATKNEGYFLYLMSSCRRHNARIDVLGWGMKWKGWLWRIQVIRDFVDALAGDELVCVIDAYDTLLLQPLEVLQTKYEMMVGSDASSIIVSKDKAQDWTKEVYGKYLFGTCRSTRLSAGAYVGHASHICTMLDAMIADSMITKPDDQLLLTRYCNKHPERITVDINRSLFLTVANHYQELDLKKEGVTINKKARSLMLAENEYPCILHAPALTHIDNILDGLGYPVPFMRNRFAVHGPPLYVFVASTLALIACMIIGWRFVSPRIMGRRPRLRRIR